MADKWAKYAEPTPAVADKWAKYAEPSASTSEANKALAGTGLSVSDPKGPRAIPRLTERLPGDKLPGYDEAEAWAKDQSAKPRSSMLGDIGTAATDLGKAVVSPITGLPGAAGEVYDWAASGFKPPAVQGNGALAPPAYATDNPLAQATGNALMAAAPDLETVKSGARTATKTIKGGVQGGLNNLGQRSVGGAAIGSALGYLAGEGPRGAAVGGAIGGALPLVQGVYRGAVDAFRGTPDLPASLRVTKNARGLSAAGRVIRGQEGGRLANPGPYEAAPPEGVMPNMEAINPEYIPPSQSPVGGDRAAEIAMQQIRKQEARPGSMSMMESEVGISDPAIGHNPEYVPPANQPIGGNRAAELSRQQISRQNGPTVDVSRSRNPEVGVSNKGPQGPLKRGPRAPLAAPPSTMPDMEPSSLSTVAPNALTPEQRIARAKAQPEPQAVTPTPEATPEVAGPTAAAGPLEGNAKAMEAARALQEEMQQSGSAPPPSQEGLSIPRESYESENRHLKTAAVDALLKKHGISWEDAQRHFSDQDWLNVFAEAKQNAPGYYSGNPAISKGQTLIKGGAPINKLRPKAKGGIVAPKDMHKRPQPPQIPNMETVGNKTKEKR